MDKKNLTIADIAEALDVSKTTVSRAISGKGRIGSATRERVMNYIEEHDYKPNMVAKGLANSCTYNIGVAMPEKYGMADAAFFVDCLAGVHQAVAARGYDIVLTICDNIDMSNLERMIARRKVDGIVLMRTFVEDHAIQMLKDEEVPFVVVGRSSGEQVVQVDQDNEKACRKLISVLLKQCRRIALIGGSMNQVVNHSRLKGYRSAHKAMNIPVCEELVYTDCDKPAVLQDAMDDILLRGADCIACMDDNICMEVLNILKNKAIEIPGQMKVTSFFNSALLEKNVPSITSISFDVKKLGLETGNTLVDMLEKKEFAHTTLLGYEIILKESTK